MHKAFLRTRLTELEKKDERLQKATDRSHLNPITLLKMSFVIVCNLIIVVNHYNWPKYRCNQQSASSHQMAKIIFSESVLFERIFTYNGGRIKHKVNVLRAARAYFSRFCLEIRLSLLSQRRCHMHFFFDVIYVFFSCHMRLFFHVMCIFMSYV